MKSNMIKAKIVDCDMYFDQIRNIRIDVFSKEQGVPQELEFDGLDPAASHSIVIEEDIEIGDIYKEADRDHIKMKKEL